jgi:hypothetical protein
MTKILLLSVTLVCVAFTLSGCEKTVDRDALISEAKVTAEENIAKYPYESMDITYNRIWVFDDESYYYYKIIINFADDLEEPYQTMWSALTAVDNGSYQSDCFSDGNIVFQEYATYQGDTYEINYLDKYVLSRIDDYNFEYVTTSLNKIKVPYVGMSQDMINHTELGKAYYHKSEVRTYAHKNHRIYTYYFTSADGETSYTVKCENDKVTSVSTSPVIKRHNGSGSSSKKSDPYNASDYTDADDFYYDHKDDFYDYEDAEDYYKKHKND